LLILSWPPNRCHPRKPYPFTTKPHFIWKVTQFETVLSDRRQMWTGLPVPHRAEPLVWFFRGTFQGENRRHGACCYKSSHGLGARFVRCFTSLLPLRITSEG
jgi:hypothetical protein